MSYQCHVCGEEHDDLPDIGADYPDPWLAIPAADRARRAKINSDLCIIDDKDHFIRAVLSIPLIDAPGENFSFGVWVSQAPHNFKTYVEHFEDSSGIGPFFGWLCTRIAYYELSTAGLKTMAHFQGGTQRPTIELEPTDHPLAFDQRNGISTAKAWDIVHYYTKG